METKTYLMLSVRLKYVDEADVESALSIVIEISKVITSLRSRLAEN